jgi:hypothetical protein
MLVNETMGADLVLGFGRSELGHDPPIVCDRGLVAGYRRAGRALDRLAAP